MGKGMDNQPRLPVAETKSIFLLRNVSLLVVINLSSVALDDAWRK